MTTDTRAGFLRGYALYTILFIILLLPFAYIAIAKGAFNYGRYPNYGFYKMSLNKTVDRGQIGMSSTRAYDADIMAAYSKTKSSTTGYAEMPSSVWPNGFDERQNNWTGTWNNYVDVMFQWTDRTGDSVGETFRFNQDSAFCTFWKQSKPCGQYSIIRFDITRWANYGAGLNRQRLVMHEVGHASGMRDYCGGDSIMNNGADYPFGSGTLCNPVWDSAQGRYRPKWLQVMSYQSVDRQSVSTTYRGY